jgi:hypothetical protein
MYICAFFQCQHYTYYIYHEKNSLWLHKNIGLVWKFLKLHNSNICQLWRKQRPPISRALKQGQLYQCTKQHVLNEEWQKLLVFSESGSNAYYFWNPPLQILVVDQVSIISRFGNLGVFNLECAILTRWNLYNFGTKMND